MIISASRRTDIPAFYSEWFMNRLKEGYVLIPNPRNPNRIGRVNLSPDNVDCIVFWTKNPSPLLEKLYQIDHMGYSYYIQFTLTPYDQMIETHLPPKSELLQTFIKMSEQIGNLRSVWRYDPIIIDADHSISWHIGKFTQMCHTLHLYTERCILSFLDLYRNMNSKFRTIEKNEMHEIASAFSQIAKQYGISLYTCSEEIDLSEYGIEHSSCIDKPLIEKITSYRLDIKKDKNQRTTCGCIESIDIGVYDTCTHGCTYCYANSSQKMISRQIAAYISNAPMLTGFPVGNEIITDRTSSSNKIRQTDLF